ncbi:YtxH domain-containing protein [Niabella defluvii]|nr:YtxH domain-containing protein [Niabella sp. I65]
MNKLLTGFALGLIVGVLYAPDKGTYTRRRRLVIKVTT